MSSDLRSDSTLARPSQIIFYMLNESQRRTDVNTDGEFGITDGVMWHHEVLADRLDEYVQHLILSSFNAASDGEDPLVVESIRNSLTVFNV